MNGNKIDGFNRPYNLWNDSRRNEKEAEKRLIGLGLASDTTQSKILKSGRAGWYSTNTRRYAVTLAGSGGLSE